MEFFKDTKINFQGRRRVALTVSAILVVIGLVSLVIHGGPNYSIDFRGGTAITLRFSNPISESEVRTALNEINLGDSEVKTISHASGHPDILIRVKEANLETPAVQLVEGALTELFPDNPFDVRQVEQVGPKIGEELKGKAVWAIVVALIGIVIYISWRFEFKFAMGAIVALIHDVLITLGVFSVLNFEISLAIVAAFLTIVGYSLNDTIVVYDRIRENVKKLRASSYFDIINTSINETLSRTVLTSGTTFVVVLVLYLFGGQVIHNFAFALLVGVVVGTYSSIFIASPILLEWQQRTGTKRKKRR
ncbi:preprotein translocase subunit SecF [bacterium SM23_57]|nr:MAG: preprotein translocase subunit SecF [bacterium SM23_57]